MQKPKKITCSSGLPRRLFGCVLEMVEKMSLEKKLRDLRDALSTDHHLPQCCEKNLTVLIGTQLEELGVVAEQIREKIDTIQSCVDLSGSMLKKIKKEFAEKELSNATRHRLHNLTVDWDIWGLLRDTAKERLSEMQDVLGLIVEDEKPC